MRIRSFVQSPTFRVTVMFTLAGLGFAGANIVLARVLSPESYARIALLVALIQVGMVVAPLGADGVVNRYRTDPTPGLVRQVLATGFGAGLLFALLGRGIYELPWPIVVALLVSVIAGGANMVAAAHYQSREAFTASLLLFQSQNAVLIVAACAAWLDAADRPWVPAAIIAAGHVVSAAVGWGRLLGKPAPTERQPYPWRASLALVGMNGATLLLTQLERVTIPRFLTLTDLATFGVLAAIVGAPFRMLQLGVGYTLVPRLRAAGTPHARYRLLRREGAGATIITLASAAALWVVTPAVARILLHGKYELSGALVLAAVVSGLAKVVSAFGTSVVTAIASPRALTRMNLAGWTIIAGSMPAIVLGARWGLVGVVYAVGLAWAVQGAVAFALGAPALQGRRAPGGAALEPAETAAKTGYAEPAPEP